MENRSQNILFLCTGNSCRSQMAEGWARAILPKHFQVFSAGTVAQGVNPNAVKAMAEFNMDISSHYSKALPELSDIKFDWVVTVCDNAKKGCPTYPSATTVIHNAFDDPPHLAQSARTDEEAFGHYRRVCAEIRDWIDDFSRRFEVEK